MSTRSHRFASSIVSAAFALALLAARRSAYA
jgi:hypothetical protein